MVVEVDAPRSAAAPRRLVDRVLRPSWAGTAGLFVITAGWLIGVRPLADNSFLTHLATGRIILDTGGVPSADPYTFTAPGEPWVVQSWLVSLLYASAEALGGLDAVRLVTGLLAALLAGLAWTLLRPADGLVVRLGVMALVLAIGAQGWSERPFMVGLICFAGTALALEGRLDPRWLVPLGWVWVNSHGSWPLGIVLVVACAVGTRLDGGPPALELRCLRWGLLGMVFGAVGPLGFEVLWFPVHLLERRELLQGVVEWQAPAFEVGGQRAFLVQVALAVVLLARRPSYRGAVVVAVFTVAALLGARNVTVASLAFLPVMAPALAGVGSLTSSARPPAARLTGVAALATLVVLSVARFDQAPLNLRRYPVGALAYLEAHDVDTREVQMTSVDMVGNLVDYVYGPQQRTFYDDRFDMFPGDVSEAHLAVLLGRPSLRSDLDELEIDLAVLMAGSPSTQILVGDPGWRALYVDDDWVLLCRRDSELGGPIGSC